MTWLWWLLVLLLPVLLHWWNQRQERVLLWGSIRLFEEGQQSRARRLAPADLWLMLLRVLLLLLLLLWIFTTLLNKETDKGSKWVLIAPHLQEQAIQKLPLGQWEAEGWQIRSASEGFPFYGSRVVPEASEVYWPELMAALHRHEDSPDSLLIVAEARMQHFGSQVVVSHIPFRWLHLPDTLSMQTKNIKAGHLQLKVLQSDTLSSMAEVALAENLLRLQIDIIHDDSLHTEARQLATALELAARQIHYQAQVRIVTPKEYLPKVDSGIVAVWLSGWALPEVLQTPLVMLLAATQQPCTPKWGYWQMRQGGIHWQFSLQCFKNTESLARLPEVLVELMSHPQMELTQRYDRRVLTQPPLLYQAAGRNAESQNAGNKYLGGLLILCIFTVERLWVWQKNRQGVNL